VSSGRPQVADEPALGSQPLARGRIEQPEVRAGDGLALRVDRTRGDARLGDPRVAAVGDVPRPRPLGSNDQKPLAI